MGRGWKPTVPGLSFPSDGILKDTASPCPASWCMGLLCAEGSVGTQGDRNLASLCCPPPASLHLGPLARWGLPSPAPQPGRVHGASISACGGLRRCGPDTLHFPISGNASCRATYCRAEKKPVAKPCEKKTIAPRCTAAAETENSRGYAGRGTKGLFSLPGKSGGVCVAVSGSEKPMKVFCKTENGSEKICRDKEPEEHTFCWFVVRGCFPVF